MTYTDLAFGVIENAHPVTGDHLKHFEHYHSSFRSSAVFDLHMATIPNKLPVSARKTGIHTHMRGEISGDNHLMSCGLKRISAASARRDLLKTSN